MGPGRFVFFYPLCGLPAGLTHWMGIDSVEATISIRADTEWTTALKN